MAKINVYARWGFFIGTGLGILLLALMIVAHRNPVAAAPSASTYAVTWYTTDNGGGISSGGNYGVSGTIGQMDAAATTTGAEHELGNGFWSAFIDILPDSTGILNEIFLPVVMK